MADEYPWWRHGVVYQIYLRSFADGDADGTGDISGLISRIPYLSSLGVDAIWVNPWYVSPLIDGGYDVADYRDINPLFGTLDQARDLIATARQAGLRVLVDLVPNHTSWEHEWFKAALEAAPGSRERRRYHFLPGKGDQGQYPPNNWKSVFGGSAWTRVPDGEWYLHMFDGSQPDLNWSNQEVRDEFIDIIRFWLDLGAAGFRVDVAHGLIKAPGYPDASEDHEAHLSNPFVADHPVWDRAQLHDVVRTWRSVLDEYEDTMMIAEAWVASRDRLALYCRPDEYHQIFDFHFLQAEWDADHVRLAIQSSLATTAAVGSIPSWVLSNHDVVRHVTRFGLAPGVDPRQWLLDGRDDQVDLGLGLRRARAAALLMFALPGSVYLYQGEELGLPEVHDLAVAVLEDPVWERSGHTDKGRDGCRVPIPWRRSGPSFGFGDNGSWLPQPEGWGELSIESQDGVEESTLELYRSAIRIRDERLRGSEDLQWVEHDPGVLALRRPGKFLCLVNYSNSPVALPDGKVLLSSGPLDEGLLGSDTAAWLVEV